MAGVVTGGASIASFLGSPLGGARESLGTRLIIMRMNNMSHAKQPLHPPNCAAKRAWLKIGMGCFEPLGLAVSIHEDLPFLTDLGNSYRLLSNTTFASVINEGVGEAIDFFLVRIVYLPLKNSGNGVSF